MKFKKNDQRTKDLGSKGGKALHPNGPTAGDEATYRYRKFTIKWLKTKHTWTAKSDDGRFTLYARSVAEIKAAIREQLAEHPDEYIKAKPEI
jgi:hypothetical protein